MEIQSHGLSLGLHQATSPLLQAHPAFPSQSSPSLWASRAAWGLFASSSLSEELLLSLSPEVSEALALGRPKGGAVACRTAGTLGFLGLLVTPAFTGVLWGLATGSEPRAPSI